MIIRRIQSIFTRFWWDSKADIRKISWVAWDTLVQPKKLGGLGFRDVEDFNDAMIAKLSWRLVKEPYSLASRVLLGKYCLDSDFLNCPLSRRASHGWRGVLIGRDVLKKGLGWRVGSGFDISVWSDNWLSLCDPLMPIGPASELAQHLRVSDLIHQDVREWNWPAIRLHIPSAEPYIRLLPLSSTVRQDSLVWLYNKSGKYSVKSGYNLLRSSSVVQGDERFNWTRNVWNVKTEPKIKSFLWKSMAGALPTGDRLNSRGLSVALSCKRCNQVESVEHVLLLCPFAQTVWDLAPIRMSVFSTLTSLASFLDVARGSVPLPPLGITLSHLYAWICWNLWTARNRFVFENRVCSEQDVLSMAVNQAKAWEIAQVPTQLILPSDATPDPLPPDFRNCRVSTICFVDAAWNSVSNCCGLGLNFRDNTDRSIFQTGASKRFVISALLAEALAVREALSVARTRGIQELHIFSDSKILVSLLNSQEDNLELSNVLFDVRTMATDFLSLAFSYVPRGSNCLADSIAKQALSELETLLLIS